MIVECLPCFCLSFPAFWLSSDSWGTASTRKETVFLCQAQSSGQETAKGLIQSLSDSYQAPMKCLSLVILWNLKLFFRPFSPALLRSFGDCCKTFGGPSVHPLFIVNWQVIESFCRSFVLSFYTFLFCCRKAFISVLVRYFWRPEAGVDLPLSMGSQVQEPACHFGFMWAAFLAVKVRVTFYSPLFNTAGIQTHTFSRQVCLNFTRDCQRCFAHFSWPQAQHGAPELHSDHAKVWWSVDARCFCILPVVLKVWKPSNAPCSQKVAIPFSGGTGANWSRSFDQCQQCQQCQRRHQIAACPCQKP